MLRRKITRVSITTLIVILIIWLLINHMKSNVEYYHLFEDQRELFEVVKDEIEHSKKGEMGYQSNFWGNILYSTPQQFHDEVRPSLREKINQINHLSGSELDILSYDESDGEAGDGSLLPFYVYIHSNNSKKQIRILSMWYLFYVPSPAIK